MVKKSGESMKDETGEVLTDSRKSVMMTNNKNNR